MYCVDFLASFPFAWHYKSNIYFFVKQVVSAVTVAAISEEEKKENRSSLRGLVFYRDRRETTFGGNNFRLETILG
jgi:hypothetical protein